jgi:replicative DNA helicase
MERKAKSTIEEINAQYGKLPPQAIELEEIVLGALMLEEYAFAKVERIIQPKSFYKEVHQKICQAIKDISDKHMPVDLALVTQYLKDNDLLEEVGGPAYIIQLTKQVASAAHVELHARIIAQKFMQREIIRVCSESQAKAYDDSLDIEDVLQHLHSGLNNIEVDISGSILTPKEGMEMIVDRIKKNLMSNSGVTGLPSGIRSLDNFTTGFQYTDLIILAAERSQGKTSLLITILNHLGSLGIPCSLISFEMSFIQLLARMISQETGVSAKRMLGQQLQNHEITLIEKCGVKDVPIYIDDDCPNSLSGVIASIRYLNKKYGVKLFGVDYLQLMKIGGNSKMTQEQELATMARELKNAAKELDVVIIALSQLNRSEKYGQEPTLGRIRGSGQVEDAADTIIFVHRPESYGIEYMDDTNYISSKGMATLIVAKGRSIGTDRFDIKFEEATGRFHEDSADDFNFNPDAFHEPERNEDVF